MKIPKVEYNIYSKLFGKNLIKLNLTSCAKSNILINVPIIIAGNIDIYNKSSGYYNDICYTTTSKYGTDITLRDRQINYISEDNIVCQEDCEFIKYNSETFIAECSCKVKDSSSSKLEISINKEKLFENFKNIKNFANFNFLVCYTKLFTKDGIVNNIGCYLIFVVIIFHLITINIFYISQFTKIKMNIKDISFAINEYELLEQDKTRKNKKVKNNNHKNKILKNDSDKHNITVTNKIKKNM